MTKFVFSTKSKARLSGVDPRLSLVVCQALALSTVDFAVVEGLRTPSRQKELYAKGRTTPGPIVTWTMKSKHIEGTAVDLVPVVDGKLNWDDPELFKKIGIAMFEAAGQVGHKIRWGYDWDCDGNLQEKGEYDGPHFELV